MKKVKVLGINKVWHPKEINKIAKNFMIRGKRLKGKSFTKNEALDKISDFIDDSGMGADYPSKILAELEKKLLDKLFKQVYAIK